MILSTLYVDGRVAGSLSELYRVKQLTKNCLIPCSWLRASFASPYWILQTSKYYTKYIPLIEKPAEMNVLHMTEIVCDVNLPSNLHPERSWKLRTETTYLYGIHQGAQ